VLSMPDPDPQKIFDNVYPTGSAEVDKQRAEFTRYMESFATAGGH